MMHWWVVYDSTGTIRRWGTAEKSQALLQASAPDEGVHIEDLVDPGRRGDDYWFDLETRKLNIKNPNPASADRLSLRADGKDEVVVRDILPGSVVLVNGRASSVDDGIFEFGTRYPGTYKLEVMTDRYKSAVFSIEAVR